MHLNLGDGHVHRTPGQAILTSQLAQVQPAELSVQRGRLSPELPPAGTDGDDVHMVTEQPQIPGRRVIIDDSPAFEFLMTLAAISHTSAFEVLEVGKSWLRSMERRAGDGLVGRARELSGNDRHIWIELLSFAATTPPPRDAGALIEHLRAADPREIGRRMAGYYDPDVRQVIRPDLIERALDNDSDAQVQLLRTESLSFARSLIGPSAAATATRLFEVLEEWAERVWPIHSALTMPILARDTAEKRALTLGLPFDRLMTMATRGVRWPTLPSDVHTVVLTPSYVMRPWVANAVAHGTMVVVYPASDAALGLPMDLPTRGLARLSAAYRATSRSGIFRELSEEDWTLTELADRLNVSSDSLLQDLLKLRAAGWVTVNADTHRYELHAEELKDLGQLLNVSVGLLATQRRAAGGLVASSPTIVSTRRT